MTTPAPQIKNNLAWAIIGLIFFWPLGIAAIIKAVKVNQLAAAGDIAGAQAAADSAKKFGIICLVIGLVLCVCGVILNVVAFNSANTAGM
jgi:uncharacterized membrane protein